MEIIAPCAGLSSRFPNVRPKYLLTDYSGKLMIQKVLEKLIKHYKVHIIILMEHVEKYDAFNIIIDAFENNNNLFVHILDEMTSGPAETVFKIVEKYDFKNGFLVRDCDSFFDFDIRKGNCVYTSKLSQNLSLSNVSNLGYVVTNEQNTILKMVEKQIVSDNFCVGGYQFESKDKFILSYNKLKGRKEELYISNIIDYMIRDGVIFENVEVKNYVNVGTLDNWFKYNDKPTIICDIDGVLVENQAQHGTNKYSNNFRPLIKNIEILLKYQKNGSRFIFTTSRPIKFYTITKELLYDLGFRNYELIMGLNHTKRILINDYSNTNPYPSSIAINLKRNEDNLYDFI